jgi:hypothetical protein
MRLDDLGRDEAHATCPPGRRLQGRQKSLVGCLQKEKVCRGLMPYSHEANSSVACLKKATIVGGFLTEGRNRWRFVSGRQESLVIGLQKAKLVDNLITEGCQLGLAVIASL